MVTSANRGTPRGYMTGQDGHVVQRALSRPLCGLPVVITVSLIIITPTTVLCSNRASDNITKLAKVQNFTNILLLAGKPRNNCPS